MRLAAPPHRAFVSPVAAVARRARGASEHTMEPGRPARAVVGVGAIAHHSLVSFPRKREASTHHRGGYWIARSCLREAKLRFGKASKTGNDKESRYC